MYVSIKRKIVNKHLKFIKVVIKLESTFMILFTIIEVTEFKL